MIDDHLDEQHCTDIAVVHQIRILRPKSNKIPIVLLEFILSSCENKGTNIAYVMGSNVVPPIVAPQPDENVTWKATGNTPESNLLGNPPEENSHTLETFSKLES